MSNVKKVLFFKSVTAKFLPEWQMSKKQPINDQLSSLSTISGCSNCTLRLAVSIMLPLSSKKMMSMCVVAGCRVAGQVYRGLVMMLRWSRPDGKMLTVETAESCADTLTVSALVWHTGEDFSRTAFKCRRLQKPFATNPPRVNPVLWLISIRTTS